MLVRGISLDQRETGLGQITIVVAVEIETVSEATLSASSVLPPSPHLLDSPS